MCTPQDVIIDAHAADAAVENARAAVQAAIEAAAAAVVAAPSPIMRQRDVVPERRPKKVCMGMSMYDIS